MSNVIILPSFDVHAKTLIKGHKAFDKASSNLSTLVCSTMQRFVDTWAVQVGKDKKACKALGKAVRDSQVVIDVVASGSMVRKTFTEYAQGAMRSLHYGVEFTPTLKNDPTKILPFSKKSTPATAKSGKDLSPTRDELDKTISKAIAQARLLGLFGFSASMVDLAIEALDGFKEITE